MQYSSFSNHHYLVHSGLQSPGGDLVLLNDMDHGSPTRNAISVEGVHHGLGDALEQLVWLHLGLPQCLRHSHQLLLTSSASNKVDGLSDTSNEVHVADVGSVGHRVKTSHDRLDEEGPEPPLIQHVGHHVSEGLWSHLPSFLELVHVHPELNLLFDCLNIRGQSGQPDPEMGVHFKQKIEFREVPIVMDPALLTPRHLVERRV